MLQPAPLRLPMAEAMAAAARQYATRPERLSQFVTELTKTPEEQDYAVRHLREAGPDAIPFLIEALARPDLSADERKLMVRNMGRLDRSVVPALAAVLDSSDSALAVDAAVALGMIGNREAIPFLTFPAAFRDAPPVVRTAAQAAIARLAGQPFSAQSRTPVQVLTDAAWRYHRHQVDFPDDRLVIWAAAQEAIASLTDRPFSAQSQMPVDLVVIWTWDHNRKALAARKVPRTEAEGILGLRLAQQALRLDPNNREAQVVQISLTLEKAIERVGFRSYPVNDPATFNTAKASGSSILTEVLKTAIADGKPKLAAVAATALGQVIDPAVLERHRPASHPG